MYLLLLKVPLVLDFGSRVLSTTPCHMDGRLDLPMFLLREGLFTLIKMYTLIVQTKFCPSLPTILKLSNVVVWPVID